MSKQDLSVLCVIPQEEFDSAGAEKVIPETSVSYYFPSNVSPLLEEKVSLVYYAMLPLVVVDAVLVDIPCGIVISAAWTVASLFLVWGAADCPTP